MSAATFSPVPAPGGPPSGATAIDAEPHRHPFGDALRAVKVFLGAAVDVVLFGEYGEEAGVRHRR
ncbi:hypothetical protein AAW14_10020 [Streptomyces hygroscopicus]|uniref:hypothetical protein n=1 Tax=Streptomyces hygroscopicus TaxID=1912 RepID=UPI00223FAC4E|nr:hypothetical protein [Streptomyces hygroscopicus]MCW7942364.1 hypothetical protein [Streptomyces hygroscopicus]